MNILNYHYPNGRLTSPLKRVGDRFEAISWIRQQMRLPPRCDNWWTPTDRNAEREALDLKLPGEFPLILSAGRHMQYNANTLMRNPAWNEGKRACTVAMNPDDSHVFGLSDGQQVRVTTEAGSELGELEVSSRVRQGTVLIPHGFGLIHDGKVHGINVNRLTKNTHRDPLGTPLHRFVPCRVDGTGVTWSSRIGEEYVVIPAS